MTPASKPVLSGWHGADPKAAAKAKRKVSSKARSTAGFHNGRVHGQQEGRQAGYREGYQEGHVNGWNEAVDKLNPAIDEQNRAIAELHAERERLLTVIEEQRNLIEAAQSRFETIESFHDQLVRQNDEFRHANAVMAQTIAGLNEAIERLGADLRETIDQLAATARDRDRLIGQHNLILVFLSVVRGTLKELTSGDSPEAERARMVFESKYHRRIAVALEQGEIARPLDESPEFLEAFSATHQFLRRMLEAAELDDRAERA